MLSRSIATFAKSQTLSSQMSTLLRNGVPAFGMSRFSSRINDLRARKYNQTSDTAMNAVITNEGLNSFITRVYKTTGMGIVGALTTSQMAIASGLAYTNPGFCGIAGIIMALGGILGTSFSQPQHYSEQVKGITHLKTRNSPMRIGLYGMGMAGLGLSSSVLFGALQILNPAILPLSIGITGAVFGSASLYALYKPKDSLLGLGSSLYAGLLGLIGLQLAGILTQLFMGPNMFSFMCHRADTFIGVGIFTAFIAYDTHVAIRSYESGYADHLGTSVDFALDFWNILIRVAQILGIFTRD